MANEEYKITSIQFKRGVKSILESRLIEGDLGIPKAGEPIWETDTNKLKIGNGVDPYVDLPYLTGGSDNQPVLRGYYFNGKFYKDSTYTVELPKSNTTLYINVSDEQHQSNWEIYSYNGDVVGFKPASPEATNTVKGVMKLYNTHGQATDGTMTQKSITDGVNSIKFAIEQTADEDGDGELENVLVLDLPWD